MEGAAHFTIDIIDMYNIYDFTLFRVDHLGNAIVCLKKGTVDVSVFHSIMISMKQNMDA